MSTPNIIHTYKADYLPNNKSDEALRAEFSALTQDPESEWYGKGDLSFYDFQKQSHADIIGKDNYGNLYVKTEEGFERIQANSTRGGENIYSDTLSFNDDTSPDWVSSQGMIETLNVTLSGITDIDYMKLTTPSGDQAQIEYIGTFDNGENIYTPGLNVELHIDCIDVNNDGIGDNAKIRIYQKDDTPQSNVSAVIRPLPYN